MKIAVISDVETERSGVGTYYADLVAHLRDHVNQIELYNPSCCLSRISFKMPGDATQVLTFPRVRSLYDKLEALGPELVVVATPGPWGFVGARYAHRHGLPLIIGFHTDFRSLTDLYWDGLRGRMSGWLLRLVHRRLFRRGEVVLVNSPGMIEEARGLGARSVGIIGTPVGRIFFERSQPPLSPTLTRVLFAGRLAAEKNLEAVIDAAARLPRLHFTIVGDGPMRARIDESASRLPNLEVRGWLSRAELLAVFDTVDLLVLPSHFESLGSIALEGLARGRNVLISENCGIAEWPMLEQSLFRMGKGEPLAEAIRRVAAHPSQIRHEKARSGAQGALQMSQHAIEGWLKALSGCGAASRV